MLRSLLAGILVLLLAPAPALAATPPGTEDRKPSKFSDPEDGWFDLSGFMDESYGFAPIVMPVTEPALGYGAAAAIVFVDKQKRDDGSGRDQPNLTALGIRHRGWAGGSSRWIPAIGCRIDCRRSWPWAP
jgi:hypothetical protein